MRVVVAGAILQRRQKSGAAHVETRKVQCGGVE